MNPFATGTSTGHAPRRSDGEHEESANALKIVGRIAKMRTKREDSARKYTRGFEEKRKREEEERERGSEGRQKSGQTERRGDGPGW